MGGRVLAGIEHGRNLSRGGPGLRDQGVGERRLAHSGLSDENACFALQVGAQRFRRIDRRKFDDPIAERGKRREKFPCRCQAASDVALVEYDQRLDRLAFGSDEAACDKGVRKRRFGRDHDDDLADVGGDQLLAELVGAVEQAAALMNALDDPLSVAGYRNADVITARQVAALPARKAQASPAILLLDEVLTAEGGDDESFDGQGVAACRWAMRTAAGGCES